MQFINQSKQKSISCNYISDSVHMFPSFPDSPELFSFFNANALCCWSVTHSLILFFQEKEVWSGLICLWVPT